MAAKMSQASGSYDKKVADSGDQQSKAKFSSYPKSAVTDKLRKPSDKGQGVKTVNEQRSRP